MSINVCKEVVDQSFILTNWDSFFPMFFVPKKNHVRFSGAAWESRLASFCCWHRPGVSTGSRAKNRFTAVVDLLKATGLTFQTEDARPTTKVGGEDVLFRKKKRGIQEKMKK